MENMDIECKKFAKEIRMLDKEMRGWNTYLGLESTVKNTLTSLKAVGELQNPAIRERHWNQLMKSTKVSGVTIFVCTYVNRSITFLNIIVHSIISLRNLFQNLAALPPEFTVRNIKVTFRFVKTMYKKRHLDYHLLSLFITYFPLLR